MLASTARGRRGPRDRSRCGQRRRRHGLLHRRIAHACARKRPRRRLCEKKRRRVPRWRAHRQLRRIVCDRRRRRGTRASPRCRRRGHRHGDAQARRHRRDAHKARLLHASPCRSVRHAIVLNPSFFQAKNMSETLIVAGWIVKGAAGRHTADVIRDGALYQRDGVIVETGDAQEMLAKYPDAPRLGSPDTVLMPGFVNSHHHVGLTPLQLGSPDHALELWFASRMGAREIDLYLDTLYSAFEMIASGITTVQHIHGWRPGPLAAVHGAASRGLQAYRDLGMRASYSFAGREQNRLVYHADDEFVASLLKELQGPMKRWFERFKLGLDDAMGMFESMHARHNNKPRVKIQPAPASLHCCSDKPL